MPYHVPSLTKVFIDAAAAEIADGAPCWVHAGVKGIVEKEKEPVTGTALDHLARVLINEPYFLIVHGEVQVDAVEGVTKFDSVYIDPDDNTLIATHVGNETLFGLCTEVAGTRGVPTGKMRVDLDLGVPES